MHPEHPASDREPPRGVPRWLWPPAGASVVTVRISERVGPDGRADYALAGAEEPARMHWNALRWLLDEHPRSSLPTRGTPFEGELVLEIARTQMGNGKVGHAYAINGGPLGAPGADGARGVLWRWIVHRLA